MLPRVDAHPLGARRRRPRAGDPAADRPLAAGGGRSRARSGPRQITIDCDVIQADGGTRTAAITGGCVALALAVRRLQKAGKITGKEPAAPAGRGDLGRHHRRRGALDLPYVEDSQAEVDCNFVMTGDGRFVEIQATAEKGAFSAEQYGALVALAAEAMKTLFAPPARGARARAAVKVVVATRNSGKLREIVPLLARGCRPRARARTIDEVAPDAELREDGATFEENALAKARQAARGHRPARHRRRLGAGGRRARRRAGRLFGPLRRAGRRRRPQQRQAAGGAARRAGRRARSARFRCVAAFVDPARGLEIVARRRLRGRDPRGAAGRRRLRLRPAVLRPDRSAARWPSCRSTRRTACRTGPRRSARWPRRRSGLREA